MNYHYIDTSALIVAIISILLTLWVNLRLESVKKKLELQLHKDLNAYQKLWELWEKFQEIFSYVMASEGIEGTEYDEKLENALDKFRDLGAKNEPIIPRRLYHYFQTFLEEIETKENVEEVNKAELINLHKKIVEEYRRLLI